MKVITFINRFLMIGVTLIFIVGLVGDDDDAIILGLLSAILLGAFQVIASLILISYQEKMVKVLKRSLNAYYLIVVFYFFLFTAMMNSSNMIGFSEEVLFTIPVLLAIGLTVIIELTYKETRKGDLNTNEVIDDLG